MAEAEVTPVAGLLGKAGQVLDHVAEPNIAALIDSISEPGAGNGGLRIASLSNLDSGKLFDDLTPFRPLACLIVHRHRAGLDIRVEDLGGFSQLPVENVQADGFVSGAHVGPLTPFDRTCNRPIRREASPVDLFFRLGVSKR